MLVLCDPEINSGITLQHEHIYSTSPNHGKHIFSCAVTMAAIRKMEIRGLLIHVDIMSDLYLHHIEVPLKNSPKVEFFLYYYPARNIVF